MLHYSGGYCKQAELCTEMMQEIDEKVMCKKIYIRLVTI